MMGQFANVHGRPNKMECGMENTKGKSQFQNAIGKAGFPYFNQ
jgi:hypothetical protein